MLQIPRALGMSLLVLQALLLLLAGNLFGQTITGSIAGIIVDASGAIVPAASVTLIHESTRVERRVESNETGGFVFPALAPGVYALKVEKPGFATLFRTGLELTANQRLSLGELQLKLGEFTETVTVRADSAVVQTESSETSGRLTPAQLDRIQVRGRDVMNLVRILPGVAQGSFDGFSATPTDETNIRWGSESFGAYASVNPIVGGLRPTLNTVTVDGQSGSDADIIGVFNASTSVQAIAEVKIVLNNYAAEYGRNSGSQVNIVSKSGTRDFHGGAYWFKRHEDLNANDFFNNRGGLPKPQFRYDTIGGTLGGPVFIPGRFNVKRDKLFFFFAHETWRARQPFSGVRQVTVPTPLERAGDFSQTFDTNNRLIPIRDPQTGQPFPGNIIPAFRINRGGQALLNVFPLANALDRNVTRGNYNYEWQLVQEVPKTLNLLKLDFAPTSKDNVSIRGRQWRSDTRGHGALGSFSGTNWPIAVHHYLFTESGANVQWTRVARPTVVNEFNIGMKGTKEYGNVEDPRNVEGIDRSKTRVTLPQFRPQLNPFNLIPTASFGGIPNAVNINIDNRFPQNEGDNRFSLSDNLSWVRGSHTLKFGVYLERNWSSQGRNTPSFSGTYNFGRDVNNPLDSNYAFSNAILGNFESYVEGSASVLSKGKNFLAEWFAQDTWKATRRLTLDYGVRFSVVTPWTVRDTRGAVLVLERFRSSAIPVFYRPALDSQNRRVGQNPLTGQLVPAALIGAFVPGTGDPANGMVLSDSGDYPEGFIDQQPLQVAPRFGFAFDVFGSGNTAVRGGFGVNKQMVLSNNNFTGQPTQSPPLLYVPQIFYGSADTLLQASGVLFPSSVRAIDRALDVPTIYNFSFGLQHKIGQGMVLDLSYVGNTTRHLLQQRDPNTLPYGERFRPENADPSNPSRPLPDNFLRPIPGYAGVNYTEATGTSNYNGLHASLNSRYSRLQAGVSYTWSKAMGLANIDSETLPMFRPRRIWSYGKLAFDQTHKLVANFIYDLPSVAGRLGTRPLRHVLDGWHLSGIATISSGTPFGISFSTVDNADITGGGDGARVVMLQNPILSRGDRSFDRWFNTSAFGRPARGDFGTAPKDVFRGPGIHNYDATFYKNFPIRGEAVYAQFRAEFYNIFNHTQFRAVDNAARFDVAGNQVNGRFGQVTSTRLPRTIQFSLNFYF